MTVKIQRFTQFGRKRRISRLSSPNGHLRHIVLWRTGPSRTAHELFGGPPQPNTLHPCIVLTIETACPHDDWHGHLHHCLSMTTT